MTCPHCAFENLENNSRCFRCGQDLDLADVDVEPTRALKIGEHRLKVRRQRGSWREPYLDATACALSSIVPGLGQALHGERVRGGLMATGWIVCLAIAWMAEAPRFAGRDLWIDWMQNPRWLPLTTHAAIIADAWQMRLRQRGLKSSGRELAVVCGLAVMLLAAPNLAVQAMRARERALGIELRQVTADPGDPTVSIGDIVAFRDLHGSDGEVRVGDVVMGTPSHFERYVQRVGTVRARAGDVVWWRRTAGRLTVNGREETLPPHVQQALSRTDDFVRILQTGELLVFPMPQERGVQSVEDALLAENHVQAVALRIVGPPSRRRILRTR